MPHPVIVYCATGNQHFKLCLKSIQSLLYHESNCTIVLYSDVLRTLPEFNFTTNNQLIKYKVIDKPSFNWFDKYKAILETEAEHIIYLDCDTIILNKFIQDMMEGLNRYDILIRAGMCFNNSKESLLSPKIVSQYNTGVMALNKQTRIYLNNNLNEAVKIFEEDYFINSTSDQSPFRIAITNSNLRLMSITADFNFMGGFETVTDKVRIVHFAGNPRFMSNSKLDLLLARMSTAKPGDVFLRWRNIRNGRNLLFFPYLKVILEDKIISMKIDLYKYNLIKSLHKLLLNAKTKK